MSTTEIFNLNSVKSTMSSIEGEFETLSTKIGEINSEITTALGSPDEAMYGDAGNKVLATWDENCSTLNSFIKIFDSWSSLVSNMATEYGELESGTAKVQDEDKEALNTIAKANKSSWLKTDEAKKAYVGSESTYKDSETGVEYTETNNLEVGRVVEYTDNDGNKIKDYYSLAGELIGTSITDKHGKITYRMDNKNVDSITTKEQQEQEKEVKKAKEKIKENIKKREEELERLKSLATQATSFYDLGDRAYNGDKQAQQEWIKKVAEIVDRSNTYGMKKSLIIAQIINESGWMSTHCSSLSKFNNVLGINYEMGKPISEQDSAWAKKRTYGSNNVSQWDSSGNLYYHGEDMRHYDSVEECIEDYCNLLYLYHPECKGSNNLNDYRTFLDKYTPNPHRSTTDYYASVISKYGLEKYDD